MWRNLTFIHIKIFDLSVLSQKKKIIVSQISDFEALSLSSLLIWLFYKHERWRWSQSECHKIVWRALNITSIALAEPDGGLGQNLASCTWWRCIISLWAAELPVLWPGLPALLSTTFIVLTVQFYFTFTCPLTSCTPSPTYSVKQSKPRKISVTTNISKKHFC